MRPRRSSASGPKDPEASQPDRWPLIWKLAMSLVNVFGVDEAIMLAEALVTAAGQKKRGEK